MANAYSDALKKAYLDAMGSKADASEGPRQIDPNAAKGFEQGYDQPQTMQEGIDNIKNEFSNLFKKKP